MSRQKLILKRATGWFAAGAEVSRALELLSDGSFKVFAFLCLNADRYTGKMRVRAIALAERLRKDEATLRSELGELIDQGVCVVREEEVEISDGFWPYIKSTDRGPVVSQVDFLRQVRSALLEPACVDSVFTPADEKLAIDLQQRGISIESIKRAIWLGCARRYAVMLDGKSQTSVTSLAYFANLIDEVAQPQIPASYWEHVRRKKEQLEERWLVKRRRPGVEMRTE